MAIYVFWAIMSLIWRQKHFSYILFKMTETNLMGQRMYFGGRCREEGNHLLEIDSTPRISEMR